MKLIYYQESLNFGDALNPMIFNHLLPGVFDDQEDEVLYGIGSILQLDYRHARKKYVLSTGYAYGMIPRIDDSYRIYALRGPLTAKALGVDPSLAISDGALLLRLLPFSKPAKRYQFSYIPHHGSEGIFDWKSICEELGYHYISPCNEPEFVIDEILASEIVLTEAMHGAIVADTLRVPWVPVVTSPHINEFKWKDWLMSVGMDYRPNYVQPLVNKDVSRRKVANRLPAWSTALAPVMSPVFDQFQNLVLHSKAYSQFRQLAHAPAYLSETGKLNQRVEMLQESVEQFRKDLAVKSISDSQG